MKIKDIMSPNPETAHPDALLKEIAQKMEKSDCGSVIIVKDDRLVGMITDRDIAIRCVAKAHDLATATAGDIMTAEILYCRDEDDADDVARNMGENKVRRLPVLNDEKRLVGIVSLGDLATHTNYHLCGEILGQICKA